MDPGTPRQISDKERREYLAINRLFQQAQIYRAVFAGQWEETAILIDPPSRNTFFVGSYNFPGQKKTQQQIDSTGMLALEQFCAIADSMVTPKTRKWHALRSNPYVMKDRATRIYFDELRDILFDFRYRPIGNFHGQNYSNWKSLGAYGNATMFVDRLDRRWHRHAPGLRYRAVPLGETFYLENHQGLVTTIIRWFRLTAEQAVEKFGIEWLPAPLHTALKENQQTPFQFLHCVTPRDLDEYDPERLDEKGKPFSSLYASIEGQCLMAPEGGYRTFPYAVSRYSQTPGEMYGRGPAQMVLPSLKTLNAEKAIFLKTGHRASDPIYLLPEDGLIDFSQIPGATNTGGVNSDGKPLVHTLQAGEIQITEKMMQAEAYLIEQMFLSPQFKTLMQNPNMTATQVIELLNERGMLVAPTLGRQFAEYVGSLVEREISLLQDMRGFDGKPILPPMPPRLREAMGEYEVEDRTPLADAARSNEAAGFMRWVEFGRQVALDTQRPDVLDRVNFDAAMPDVAYINGVPTKWINDDRQMAALRKSRAAAQQREQQIQALPAQAAMLKAQATVRKNELGNAPMQTIAPQQGAAA